MSWPATSPGRLLERIGDDAPRGMTVHDRTRLIGRLCRFFRAMHGKSAHDSQGESRAPSFISRPPLALRASRPLTQGAVATWPGVGADSGGARKKRPRFAGRIAGPAGHFRTKPARCASRRLALGRRASMPARRQAAPVVVPRLGPGVVAPGARFACRGRLPPAGLHRNGASHRFRGVFRKPLPAGRVSKFETKQGLVDKP